MLIGFQLAGAHLYQSKQRFCLGRGMAMFTVPLLRRRAILLACCLLIAAGTANFSNAQQPGKSFGDYFASVKRSGDRKLLRELLLAFPKGADLHSHLSGVVPVKYLIEIAERFGYQAVFSRNLHTFLGFVLPGLKSHLSRRCSDPWSKCVGVSSLSPHDRENITQAITLDMSDPERTEAGQYREFTRIFHRMSALTNNADVMPVLVKRAMQIAAHQNITYLELKIIPMGRKDSQGNRVLIEVLLKSLRTAVDEMNQRLSSSGQKEVVVRFIAAFSRRSATTKEGGPTNLEPIRCSPTCPSRLTQGYYLATGAVPRTVVGVDLVGLPEVNIGHSSKFPSFLSEMQHLARRFPGANITLHAGETHDPAFDHHVQQAIAVGAKRIGHAFNVHRLPAAQQAICNSNIAIEISLTSNLRLGLPANSTIRDHPFATYFRRGICQNSDGYLPVTLTTDDAGFFATDLTEEFVKAVMAFDLSWPEVKKLARNSLEYAFVETRVKKKLLSEWETAVKTFVSTYPRSRLSPIETTR